MDTDSSLYYETTYSEDERIENAQRIERNLLEQKAARKDRARKELYESYLNADLDIFKLVGLTIHTFRHLKIKFSFHPATISNFVNKNVIFFISLKYVGKYWRVKRDSLPVNYKWKVYRLFYDEQFFTVDDENIFLLVLKIYDILLNWTETEKEFRLSKYERYKNGDDIELDSDDAQMFLDENERVLRYQKRLKVLKRMLPPKHKHSRRH